MIINDNVAIKDYDEKLGSLMGKHFAEEREKSGMSLEEVSYKMGIKLSRYYSYEHGDRNCSVGMAREFCKLLGIDFFKFFTKVVKEAESL